MDGLGDGCVKTGWSLPRPGCFGNVTRWRIAPALGVGYNDPVQGIHRGYDSQRMRSTPAENPASTRLQASSNPSSSPASPASSPDTWPSGCWLRASPCAERRGGRARPEWLAAQGTRQIVQADLLDPAALTRAAAGCRAVVHAAAWTGGPELSPEAGYRVNVEGTRKRARCRAGGRRRTLHLYQQRGGLRRQQRPAGGRIDADAAGRPGVLRQQDRGGDAGAQLRSALCHHPPGVHLRPARYGVDGRPHREHQAGTVGAARS